jgi:hypothetical protein
MKPPAGRSLRPALRDSSRDLSHAAKDSTASTTASKRMEPHKGTPEPAALATGSTSLAADTGQHAGLYRRG